MAYNFTDLPKLEYLIHKCSGHAAEYVPENVLKDLPNDQSSRWATNSNVPPQFLMLRLMKPAIVKAITFGRYMKSHVCDLKKFSIFGGMDEHNLSELYSGGLKHEGIPETFTLRHHTKDGLILPVKFISVVPYLSWGPAFNFTVWYLELRGETNTESLRYALQTIHMKKEEDVIRLCLKHLRRRNYKDAYQALSRESGVRLEAPITASLWDALVENGNYDGAEKVIEQAARERVFDWYLSWQPYKPTWRALAACVEGAACSNIDLRVPDLPKNMHDISWTEKKESSLVGCEMCNGAEQRSTGSPSAVSLSPTPAPTPHKQKSSWKCTCSIWNMPKVHYLLPFSSDIRIHYILRPGARGGHQLVVDSADGVLYLLGGWDGVEDLDDLWRYDVGADRWTLLCRSSGSRGGPTPRSCHKMVLDPNNKRIFTIGRYLELNNRLEHNMKNDMYVFDIATCEWSQICDDTSKVGGPRLVFDHQMCIDPLTCTIYVFGGRVLPVTGEEGGAQYSGLYAYSAPTDTWKLLVPDGPTLLSRVGHSMLFNPVQRKLYIFAGQRNKEHLLDFVTFDVDTHEVAGLGGGPAAPLATPHAMPTASGVTQRATIDPQLQEIYVLSGLSKAKEKRVCNALWVFSIRRNTWSCIYRNDDARRHEPMEPCPRFAHQLVYDPVSKIHYLFGGNPGLEKQPHARLDDFWSLTLTRPTAESLVRRLRTTLRQARYEEMAIEANDIDSAYGALRYLQTSVADVFDHENVQEAQRFRSLPTALFAREDNLVQCPSTVPLTAPLVTTLRRRRRRAANEISAKSTEETLRTLQIVLAVNGAENKEVIKTEAVPPDTGVGEISSDDEGEEGEITEKEEKRAALRLKRSQLYDRIVAHFPPHAVPPKEHLSNFITL